MSTTEKVRAGRPGARWAFMEGLDVGTDGDPYLDRLRLLQTPLFGIYLHHIHREDIDPDPHDHPWGFVSLVLAGWYREMVWPDKRNLGRAIVRERPRWSLRRLGRGAAHIITATDGTLWTLVLVGPRRGDWGFWTPRGYVPWRTYINGPQLAATREDTCPRCDSPDPARHPAMQADGGEVQPCPHPFHSPAGAVT